MALKVCPKGHLTGINTERCPQCRPKVHVSMVDIILRAAGKLPAWFDTKRYERAPVPYGASARIVRSAAPPVRKWRLIHRLRTAIRGKDRAK